MSETNEEEKAAVKNLTKLLEDAHKSGVEEGHRGAVSYVRKVIGNPKLADVIERALAMLGGGTFNIPEAMSLTKAVGELRKEGLDS